MFKRSIVLLCASVLIIITMVALVGCGDTSGDEAEGAFKDGTYTASAEGYNGPIEIEVVASGGAVTAINVVSHDETSGISDAGFDDTISAIIANQSTDGIDTVSGATATSQGVLDAAAQAMAEAAN